MQRFIDDILDSGWLWHLSRALLAVVFVAGGLAKVIDFDGGLAEMRAAGLEPAVLFNIATAATLLGGALLILVNRAVWLGAGMLSVFLVLTIVVVHTFWALPEPQARYALFFALEHISVIGGLIAVSIASRQRALRSA